MTLPAGQVTYGYDGAGRLAQVGDWTGGSAQMAYTADGLTSRLTLANGARTTYGYDGANRLTSVHADTGTGTALQHFDTTLDPAGNRTATAGPSGTESYTLDALNRITGVSYPGGPTQQYAYDAAGNRTSATVNGTTTPYTYNAAGDLTAAGATTFTHDAAGNRTGAGATTYAYDYASRLTRAGGTSYTYDVDGVRTGATTGSTTTPYVYDRQAGQPQLVADGTTSYLRAGNSLISEITVGTAQFPIQDALGSVRGLAGASQVGIGTTSYDVFGTITSHTGAQSSLGFTGEQQDPATGLVNLRARTMDPSTGQFLSSDTLQPNAPGTQGYNRFAYVGNNPTTATDPTGHEALVEFAVTTGKRVVVGAGIGGLGGGVLGAVFCRGSQNYGACIARQAASGAVAGAVGGLFPLGGVLASCLSGAAAGLAGDLTSQSLSGTDFNGEELAASGALGCGVGSLLRAASPYIAQAARSATKGIRVPPTTAGPPSNGPRFITNASGGILDMSRVEIPGGKFGYLLDNPGKAGVFRDSMGFDQKGLDDALRSHLRNNWETVQSTANPHGGTKINVKGPMTGPSRATWDITSVWNLDGDGTIRLITATP